MRFEFTPGSLVTVRNRPWVVLPSDNPDLFLIKPLGGTDEEITGIFKPVAREQDIPVSYDFIKPSASDLGNDYQSARLLYNASRLSFRAAAGPFRALGKLSFRPRSYQMVPMIMALQQSPVRLMIADDVGVGKTIEALLIAKELYERKEIKRFAIVCLPHLCDQWQDELKNKFGIEAVIIRSGSISSLERNIRSNETIFDAYPFQIISIDFIKSGGKRETFINHCPDLLIVDEAHTCAKPAGANNSQQQRYKLLHDLTRAKSAVNLILLTATPHSGKQEEFQSLLGLLKPEFEHWDILSSTPEQRKIISKHFIQRRRADILNVIAQSHDDTLEFPERESKDEPFELGKLYADIFNDVLAYGREIVSNNAADKRKQRFSYWDALALLRGVMSSPAAGVAMLEKKAINKQSAAENSDADEDGIVYKTLLDDGISQDDELLTSALNEGTQITETEAQRLLQYARRLNDLKGMEKDAKARAATIKAKEFILQGFNPIIFCRYIQTANYLGEVLKGAFQSKDFKDIQIEVITSELGDELRKEKIKAMQAGNRRVLIATDCLSEGINLQEGFNALIHYDLPWNPNRLEQREGRIDRFGQQSKTVKIAMLYGSNNPIDGVVLNVLLRKAIEIRKSIGISVPFPENSASVMETLTQSILLSPSSVVKVDATQLSMFETEEVKATDKKLEKLFKDAEEREKVSRSIFAHNAIKIEEIEADLQSVDETIGNVLAVELFVVDTLRFIGAQVDAKRDGYKVYTINIPQRLKSYLTEKPEIQISFKSPTPAGYTYIGRNHPFTEMLAQTIINDSLKGDQFAAARTVVLRTRDVKKKTVLMQFRVRNVIAEQPSNQEIVAEEMWLWGYEGGLLEQNILSQDACKKLLIETSVSSNIDLPEQEYWLNEELKWVNDESHFREVTDPVGLERAEKLVEAHSKFRKLVKSNEYKVVEPVLPMDVLGMYILLPEVGL